MFFKRLKKVQTKKVKKYMGLINDITINLCYICQSAEYILELCIPIQIRTIQLLIFTEKFSPLLGFEPGTSPVQSRYATN